MRFQNGSNEVAIELSGVQFWSEIIIVIPKSNRTRAARLFDFEFMHMISDQIALPAQFNYHYSSIVNKQQQQQNTYN